MKRHIATHIGDMRPGDSKVHDSVFEMTQKKQEQYEVVEEGMYKGNIFSLSSVLSFDGKDYILFYDHNFHVR